MKTVKQIINFVNSKFKEDKDLKSLLLNLMAYLDDGTNEVSKLEKRIRRLENRVSNLERNKK